MMVSDRFTISFYIKLMALACSRNACRINVYPNYLYFIIGKFPTNSLKNLYCGAIQFKL